MKSHFIPLHLVFPYEDKERLVEILLQNLANSDSFDNIQLMHKEGTVGFCLHYDEKATTQHELVEIIRESGAEIAENYKNKSYILKKMHSSDCARLIEKRLTQEPGIYHAAVAYSGSKLVVEFDNLVISYHEIKSIIVDLGFDISRTNYKLGLLQKNRELIFSLLSGCFLLLSSYFYHMHFGNSWYFAILLSYFFGVFYTFKHSLHALRNCQLDIDILMVLAAFGAAFIGKWFEGALLLFLFSLGHGLEHKAMHKARSAITSLTKLAPKVATVKRNQKITILPVDDLVLGDIVMVKPGERIACDGDVLTGYSAVNQAAITGESMPVDKGPGSKVFAGTINGHKSLTLEVTKLACDSTLSKMVQLMLDADAKKSKTQHFTERFERIFVPFVLIFVISLMILPQWFWGWNFFHSFYNAMLVLVAASPCALAIGTPAAVLSAVASSAKMGVMIKGGIQLERLAMIKVLALDKTGTITTGAPELQQIIELDDFSERQILYYAASVEQASSHPISRALLNACNEQNIELCEAHNVTELVGRGIIGFVEQREVVIGNIQAYSQVSPQVKAIYKKLQQAGATTMLVAVDGVFKGAIAVHDVVRPGVDLLLKRLQDLGISQTVMLTGDNNYVAKDVAENVGISDYYAELLPADKVAKISALEEQSSGKVAMLGDGVNDAPAMATALVGIAMGGAGSDVALDAADVVLMQDDLTKLPDALALSKKAALIIKQNVSLALISIVLLVAGALGGFLNLSLTVFFHESTSVLVVLNGLRLLRFRPATR